MVFGVSYFNLRCPCPPPGIARALEIETQAIMKKALRETQHCALAVVGGATNFRPAADPLPGGAGPPKFKQLERVTTCIYKPSLVKIGARNFELSW